MIKPSRFAIEQMNFGDYTTYTVTQTEFDAMLKQSLKDDLALYSDLKQRMRDAQMVYQYEEKHEVAKHYKISFEKLANLEFHRWRKIANRYVDRMYK